MISIQLHNIRHAEPVAAGDKSWVRLELAGQDRLTIFTSDYAQAVRVATAFNGSDKMKEASGDEPGAGNCNDDHGFIPIGIPAARIVRRVQDRRRT